MIFDKVINFISKPECQVCRKPGSIICLDCWRTTTPLRRPACFWCNSLTEAGKTCTRCARKTHLKGSTIPFRLDGLVKEQIHNLKYRGDRESARFLASEISCFLPTKKFDYITYVPATGKSQRKRGYNQARLLAKQLSRDLHIPLRSTLLRLTHTDQIGQSRAGRLAGVKGNFISRGSLEDKVILLVDDVVTTGATLNECAYTLKLTGAKSVWGVAVAKK